MTDRLDPALVQSLNFAPAIIMKTSIRGLPTDWKRPPGRPRHTWLRTLGADLQPHNLGLNSAWKYAQDREHSKHLVETATFQLGARA